MRYVLVKRPSRKKWNKKQILSGRRPIRRGIVSRARDDVTTKKPHSAKRKVAAFYIQNKKYLKNRAYMPGEEVKGQLKKYDTIFFNGNRRRDVPALKYTIVYGVHTKRGQMSTRVTGINYRRKARSKYGVKRFVLEPEKAAAAAGIIAADDAPVKSAAVQRKKKVKVKKKKSAKSGGIVRAGEGSSVSSYRGHWGSEWVRMQRAIEKNLSESGSSPAYVFGSDASKWKEWDYVERAWIPKRSKRDVEERLRRLMMESAKKASRRSPNKNAAKRARAYKKKR